MNPHQDHKTSLTELFSSFFRNRKLIYQMAKRDVLGRYRGSMVGLAWSFFNPLLMLGVYTVFFSFVLKSRWGVSPESGCTDFAIVLFVGLIIHGLFSECLNRAPLLIHSNVSYVKKVIFPLEVFPWVAMGSALFHASISVGVLISLQLLLTGHVLWTAALFPIVIAPFVLLTLGIAWFLAATGVYLRDVTQVTGMITSVFLFISPIFYPISILPPKIQLLTMLNPLTLIIEESRKVLLFGKLPDLVALGIYALLSLVVALIGFWVFQKTRKGFADVL